MFHLQKYATEICCFCPSHIFWEKLQEKCQRDEKTDFFEKSGHNFLVVAQFLNFCSSGLEFTKTFNELLTFILLVWVFYNDQELSSQHLTFFVTLEWVQ